MQAKMATVFPFARDIIGKRMCGKYEMQYVFSINHFYMSFYPTMLLMTTIGRENQIPKRPLASLAVFLQAILVILAIGALAFLLWEPQIEGRNAHATFIAIYCKDPFLAYAYFASIPFFIALYQAFKALGYLGKQKEFPQEIAKALRKIRVCAFITIGFVALGELFIMLGDSDDRTGGFFMGFLIAFGSIIVATVASKLERVFGKPRV